MVGNVLFLHFYITGFFSGRVRHFHHGFKLRGNDAVYSGALLDLINISSTVIAHLSSALPELDSVIAVS